MTIALRYARAGAAILSRDLIIYSSYRLRFVTGVLSSLLVISVFYYVSRLVRVGFARPEDYFAFVAVGVVILGVVSSTLGSTPGSIRQELVAGTFERTLTSPFGAVSGIVSMMIFPFLYAIANGAVVLVGAWLVFDLPVHWSTAPLAVPAAVLGVLAFLPFGILIGAAVIVTKQAQAAGNFVLSCISVVAGLYFPVALLPSWIQWVSDVQPFTPAADLMRNLLVGTPLDGSGWLLALRLALFAAILIPPSLWALARAIRFGRRQGTITEY